MPGKLVFYPASVLKDKAVEVAPGSAAAHAAIADLKEVMRATKRDCLGLSAPQANHSLRIFILNTDYLRLHCKKVFINPVVTWTSEMMEDFEEGCLSFPDSVGVVVRRPYRCTVEALDVSSQPFKVELSGMAARCVLHEIDHLNGTNIIDYATPKKKKQIMQKICVDIKRGKH